MEEKKEEEAPVNTGTESKLVKIFKRIFIIVVSLVMIILIYKMLMHRFG